MKLAAFYALVSLITEEELNENNVITNAFNTRVVEREAEVIAKAARERSSKDIRRKINLR